MVNDLQTSAHDKAPFKFLIRFYNPGGSAGRIISGNFTIQITTEQETPSFGFGEPAYRPDFDWLEDEIIPAGPDSPFVRVMDRSLSFKEIQDLMRATTALHVYGFIFYRSRWRIFPRTYRTAFCRKYHTGAQELLTTPSSAAYEYSD